MGQNQAIRQRISLEGGDTIKQQLEAIGAAGKKAFTDLQNAVRANSAFGNIGAAIDAVKAKAALLGTAGANVGRDWSALGDSFRNTASSVAIAGAAVAALTFGLVHLVTGVGDTIDKIQNAADALGITTKEFENMSVAAQSAGIGPEVLTKSLNALNKALGDTQIKSLEFNKKQASLSRDQRDESTALSVKFSALAASERDLGKETKAFTDLQAKQNIASRKLIESHDEESDAFTRLGIATKNADGSLRNIKDVRDDIADAFKGMADGVDKSRIAMDLFGSRNTKFLTFMNQGSVAIRALEAEAERIAPAMDKFQIEVGDKVNDAFQNLKDSANSASNAVRLVFAPDALRVFKSLTEAVVRNRTAFILLAADIERKVRPIIDDVIAIIDGRDADVKNGFIIKARDSIVEFGTAARKAVTEIILPALAGLLAALDIVAKAINGLFGTDLSGKQIAIALVLTKVLGLFGLFTAAVKLAISAIALLATALGGPVALALAALAFAIGFVLVRAIQSVNWKALGDAAAAVWTTITGAVTTLGSFIVGVFNGAVQLVIDAWNRVIAFFVGTGQAIGSLFNSAATAISDAFNTCVEFVLGIWNGLLAFFAALPATIVSFFVSIGEGIKSAFLDAVNSVKQFFTDLFQTVTNIFNNIVAGAQRVASAIKSALSGGSGLSDQAGLSDIGGKAGGGPVRGRGTGTSDSILSWLSNGEFVMKTRAVQKWGLGVMHALNNGINPFAGFSAGGFVDALTDVGPGGFPSFASGGLAMAGAGGGGTPVYLTLPNGKHVGPMMTGKEVLRLLKQESISARIGSASRAPDWVR